MTMWNKIRVYLTIYTKMFIEKYIPFGKKFRCGMYSLIGEHYFQKNGRNHTETKRTLELIGICSVWYRRGYLYIKCSRPGILIGKRGADINTLTEYLKENWQMKIPFDGIRIVEDKEIGHLYNYLFWDVPEQEQGFHWTDMDD